MKNFKRLGVISAATLMLVGVVACKKDEKPVEPTPQEKTYTYNTFTAVSPSNWNELTYKDNNDTQILNYLTSSFFTFDYKFDSNGEIKEGDFTVKYDAATKLEDVTTTYAKDDKYSVPDNADKGFAYKITLRNDLKWDDGTPITAADYVYTMKEQLNPLFKNYRADSYYNSGTVIHNAKKYFYQGSKGNYSAKVAYDSYDQSLDSKLVFQFATDSNAQSSFIDFLISQGLSKEATAAEAAQILVTHFVKDNPKVNVQTLGAMEGKTLAAIKADPTMKDCWDELLKWWKTLPDEELDFFVVKDFTWPEVDFNTVGLKQGDNDRELVLVLDKQVNLLEENGDLSYLAAYQLSSLPLVHKAKYEQSKKAPVQGSSLWTTNYNSSVDTSASFGPYKLTQFQSGKSYTLEKNENWYGYSLPENEGLYQTQKIFCETVGEYETAWLKFLKGEIDEIGLDVTKSKDYKNSSRAFYTPSDFVGSMQLQSNESALKNRESQGINKTILSNVKFRKAISLSINRADYNNKCTASSKAGFGLFNDMHYYDVAHGKRYRDTDAAKKVLLETYGVDQSKYPDLDSAVDAITGYDLAQARKLVDEAYDEWLAAGKIKANDVVKFTFGAGADNENVRRHYNYVSDSIKKLVEGTKLQGRLETEFKNFQTGWADDFRGGAYDIAVGAGWKGAAWDPGYFLLAYLSPNYMYSTGWNTSAEQMTFTMTGVDSRGNVTNNPSDKNTFTKSLMQWYDSLNNEWAVGNLNDEYRVELIAALEGKVLTAYYTVPLSNDFSTSLMSFKTDYVSYDYNTFMAYGGIKYMKYNYSDAEWAQFVKNSGELNYK